MPTSRSGIVRTGFEWNMWKTDGRDLTLSVGMQVDPFAPSRSPWSRGANLIAVCCHVVKSVSLCNCHLRRLQPTRRCNAFEDALCVVVACVISARLDYCNPFIHKLDTLRVHNVIMLQLNHLWFWSLTWLPRSAKASCVHAAIHGSCCIPVRCDDAVFYGTESDNSWRDSETLWIA